MTKRELYLFNPDNDLSLASGEVNYMPPATARRMAEELALLPAWYASAGSAVLAPSAYNLAFLREMQECLSGRVGNRTGSSFDIKFEAGALGMESGFEETAPVFGDAGNGIAC